MLDKERAKKVLEELKAKNLEFKKSFDAVVKQMVNDLEIPEHIASQVVLDQITNDNLKELILYDIFSPSVLKKNNI